MSDFRVEVRRYDEPADGIDEVLLYHGERCVFHMEQMNDECFWFAFNDAEEIEDHFNIFIERGSLVLRGDNDERPESPKGLLDHVEELEEQVAKLASERDALQAKLASKDRMIRHEAEDWSEVDDALEKAGVVMSVDGYHKPQVEAVEELAERLAKCEAALRACQAKIPAHESWCLWQRSGGERPCNCGRPLATMIDEALSPKE